jgi:hypothetical protein
MRNCQDTVVNWLLLRNNFVVLYVRPVLIGAINPLLYYYNLKIVTKIHFTVFLLCA